jgi:hypothetical protein
MKGALAAILRSLVLPAGATSGQRIVLDGVNGLIDTFDTAGIKRIELGQTDGLRVFTGDASEVVSGHLNAVVIGAGGTRRLALFIDSPQFSGLLFPTLLLESQSFDGTLATKIQLSTDLVAVTGLAGLADITLNNQSLPRGVVAYQRLTASDVARAAGVNTDMTVTFTADATRLYEVVFRANVAIGTLSVVYAINLSEGGTVGLNDGSAVDRFLRVNTAEAAVSPFQRTASLLYLPTAGAKTIRVRNDPGSGGTITLQADASSSIGSRSLTVKDIGAR